MSLPETDIFLRSREEFEDQIVAAMGGRAAEEVIFNQFTTGASGDLQQVTQLARNMVTQYGMSDKLGPRTFGSNGGGTVFLGREFYGDRDYSEQAAEEIDNEVKRIVSMAYERAKALLIQNRDKLENIARVLLDQETLDRVGFEDIMEGRMTAAPTPAAFSEYDETN